MSKPKLGAGGIAKWAGGVWHVRHMGFWGTGPTIIEAVHHARFQYKIELIIRGYLVECGDGNI